MSTERYVYMARGPTGAELGRTTATYRPSTAPFVSKGAATALANRLNKRKYEGGGWYVVTYRLVEVAQA